MTRVLIIDDDLRHRESIGDVIDSFGYAVESAANVEQAKTVIGSRGPFQLVLLDYMFGPQQKTGLDALGDLRALLPVEEVPILLMTGYASLDVAVRAMRQGLSDFLIKPIDPVYLKHALEKNLEKFQLIAENKRLLEELKKTNEDLARLNDVKSKFLSFCAHDLSNTISSTVMATELLLRHYGSVQDPSQQRLFTLLQDSIAQTQRLTSDLVDYASIEKGKFHIAKNRHSLSEIVNAPTVSLFAEKTKIKKVVFETSYPADLNIAMEVDIKRVLQVLGNLLENALRYAPQESRVRLDIEVSPQKDWIVFAVRDFGQGIDQQDLPHLFESFYQGKDSTKRGKLGLGLAIAKEIVEGHGGKIWVESEGSGKGSVFSFKIPINKL